MRIAPKLSKESKTRAMFSDMQLQYIQEVKEAVAIVKTIAVANKAQSINKDINININKGIAIAIAKNHLNNMLIALIINLLAQNTS